MQIDASINLVIPITETIKAYHTPISPQVFEANYRVLSATKAALFAKGIAYAFDAGPRIATLRLKDEGLRDAQERLEEGDGGVGALLAEIKRLTTVLVPGNGWEMLPVINAHIDPEDWQEAEASLVFFTCLYAMSKKTNRGKVASGAASLLGGSITPLSLSDWIASSPASTPEKSGPATSSVPV
ncbi:MAG: hypothetical protein ACYCS8_16750 [Acidithiobacillus sp.]